MNQRPSLPSFPLPRRRGGFSLIELMVSIGISMVLLAGLAAMLVNVSNNNQEMAKNNSQIENGRYAIQALEMDLVQAGFWGTFVPQYDDMTWVGIPADTPTAIPPPCRVYDASTWDFTYVNGLVGMPVVSSDARFTNCDMLTDRQANTDVLLVRHAEACVAGAAGCDADVSGRVYFQGSLCAAATNGVARDATSTTMTLPVPGPSNSISGITNAYAGMRIHATAGPGSGQSRTVTAYNATTNVVTVDPAWTAASIPTSATSFTITENIVGTTDFTQRQRGADCATAAVAGKRRFISNIYYVRSWSVASGDGIPTLVRSTLDLAAGEVKHQAPVPLVEGIERFTIELGIDESVNRCSTATSVNYGAAPALISPTTCAVSTNAAQNTLPTNRGDGAPDRYKRCTTASPCTVEELRNVVSAKLFLLVRNNQTTQGYTDNKTYCMASTTTSTCPLSVSAPGDGYQRHLFTTTVRLSSVAGRRESP